MDAVSGIAESVPAIEAAPPSGWDRATEGVKRYAGRVALGLLLPVLVLALWQIAVERVWVPPQLLPPPTLVWDSLLEMLGTGELFTHVGVSLRRVSWSLLIGTSAGFALGFLMALSRRAHAYLYPSFSAVSQFPVVGWAPLLIIFFGIDEAFKISAVSLAVAVPVTVNTFKGVRNVPTALIDVARVYRFSLLQTVFAVAIPAALPSVFNGIRQGVMQAWLALVFVELMISSEGIGYLMVWGRQLMQLDLVVVAMIAIGVVGLAFDGILTFLEKRLARWQPGRY